MTTPTRREREILDVISKAIQDKYGENPYRDETTNLMFLVYLHLSQIVQCARGLCHKSCGGVIQHIEYLANQMANSKENL